MDELDEKHHALYTALQSLGAYQIDYDHIKIDMNSKLGQGGFGVVRPAMLYGQIVAVKCLRSDESKDIRVANQLVREMKVWSGLRHQNILPLIGFHLSRKLDIALIVCPLEPHGSLRDYVLREKPSDPHKLSLARDTLEGLVYLHGLDPAVIHGDIKAANALVTQGRRAVLSDFGLAVAAAQAPTGLTTSRGLKGSIRWFSPELVKGHPRSPASDVWAWACLFLEIMKGCLPFSWIQNEVQIILAHLEGTLPEPSRALKAPMDLWSVIEPCWEVDLEKRATGVLTLSTLTALIAATDAIDKHSQTNLVQSARNPIALPVSSGTLMTISRLNNQLLFRRKRRFKQVISVWYAIVIVP
ncbi:hypothetical protein FRB96_008086 [Tulasnella sp. 330]|nr:hypothetical protein FRB96_008086 [Tulasnella sp. 330]